MRGEARNRSGTAAHLQSVGTTRGERGIMQGHTKQSPVLLAVGFLAAAISPRPSEARLVRLEVQQRELFVDGIDWEKPGRTSDCSARRTWRSILAIRSTR